MAPGEFDAPDVEEGTVSDPAPEQTLGDVNRGEFPRPAPIDRPTAADADGTFDLPEAGKPVAVPPELFQLPARDVAKAFLAGVQRAPNLQVPGNPRRTSKNHAHYLQAFIKHLSQALERI